ncbi:hypothetical protein IAU59_005879 [Kwoniella sp. CBS 9459]
MSRPPFPIGWSSIPLDPKNLTLANTLPVGQSFLWRRLALQHGVQDRDQPIEEFSRAVDNPPRVVCLRQTLNHLHYTAIHPDHHSAELDKGNEITRKWLFDYFQLETQPDLEKLYADWRQRDPGLFGKVEVSERALGVRVLRQDPWECLIALKDEFGTAPGAIEQGLLGCRDLDVDTVRDKLIAFKGVGRKVADCVMLMCMDKVYDETQQFLLDKWGPMGGWCQAVMFAADLPAAKPKKVTKVITTSVKRIIREEEHSPSLKRTRSATRDQMTEVAAKKEI